MKKLTIAILSMNIITIVLTLLSPEFDMIYLYFNGCLFYPLLLVAVVVYYIQIFYLMKKLHRYEFEKNRSSMTIFAIFSVISNLFNVIHFGSAALFGYNLRQIETPNIQSL
jgi:membrane protein YdbS with pleckstrin-like domain